MPTVTMTLEEFNELKAQTSAAEARSVQLEAELRQARLLSDEEKAKDLLAAYRRAKTCTDFMVANLDPEFIRAMPYAALEELAELVEKVGGDGQKDSERAMIWREHARRIVQFETDRMLRDRQKPKPEAVDANSEGT